jgi:hypothetical protein
MKRALACSPIFQPDSARTRMLGLLSVTWALLQSLVPCAHSSLPWPLFLFLLTENEFLQPHRALALHRALGSPMPRSDFWDPPSNLSTASGWAHHAAGSSFPRATRSRALQPPEIKDHGLSQPRLRRIKPRTAWTLGRDPILSIYPNR